MTTFIVIGVIISMCSMFAPFRVIFRVVMCSILTAAQKIFQWTSRSGYVVFPRMCFSVAALKYYFVSVVMYIQRKMSYFCH